MTHRPRTLRSFRRRRAGTAWLATVALLFNLLLPTAFFIGADAAGQPTAIGFCGTVPGRAGPHGNPAAPAAHHCIFCYVAAVAPAPSPPSGVAAPRFAGVSSAVARPGVPQHSVRFAAAQPRGPPATA